MLFPLAIASLPILTVSSMQAAAVEARESFKKSVPAKAVVVGAYTGYAGLPLLMYFCV